MMVITLLSSPISSVAYVVAPDDVHLVVAVVVCISMTLSCFHWVVIAIVVDD
jgi:hypothetical protein